jgi:hypothetical protein
MKENQKSPIWEKESSAGGATESERYLAKLARRAFLNFWSYSNPFTDEGDGKELCDFMVVFGDHIIIFSDKHCEFPKHDDIKVAWHRWYRSAIEKSARQLVGAASFVERFPERIYLDSDCEHPLPIPLPSSDNRKIHLIAVTRGSAEAAKKFWKNNSSSSLLINTNLTGPSHKDHPFMVGRPLNKGRFVHVLDEMTLDILLNELDTASDFAAYLTKKEEYLSSNHADFIICGEEELLASYFMHPLPDYKGFSFPPIPPSEKLIFFQEGKWNMFSQSKAYSAWKKKNEISYEWDRLIEHQTSHIQRETAAVLFKRGGDFQDIRAHEFVLRAMAEEGRIARQILAENHHYLLTKDSKTFPEIRLVRTLVLPQGKKRAYVLLVLIQIPGQDYDEYREARRESLLGYCQASRLRIDGLDEVVGIASEQSNSPILTQDFMYMQFDKDIPQKKKEEEVAVLRAAGIWKEHWRIA